EWERLEFKAGWNPLQVLHTLCAFANDFHNLGGGYLVLGVAEEGGRPVLPPVGLDPARIDAIQKDLLNLGNSAILPPYHPIAVPYEIEGRHILVLWAPGGQTRPYRARTSLARDSRDYGWFIRKGSSTVRARGADETELLGMAATVPFDDRLNLAARVEDLSFELMVAFLREVGSDLAEAAPDLPLVELGRQMHVVSGTSEAPFPLNVGLLFFHPEPWRFFPVTQIDVVWFPDGPGGDHFTEKVFRGPLPRMTREALDYIRRNYVAETVTKHADRPESTRVESYPFDAIEEAVVNAVYHRGYDVREPVEVRITPEELVVLSYPGPDRSVKLEQLRAGRADPRRYRNRRIGEFLKELDLTEGRGTGIPKILRAMSGNGSPPPEFEFDEDHSYFLVRLPVHPVARLAASEQVTGEVTEQVAEQVTEQVKRLVSAMGGESASATEIMALLGLAHRPSFLYTYLQPALEAGLVVMTLPDKPRSSKQRYRLTAAGRAWKAARGKP
ncbi:MAG: Fic family protein, partial [Pseudomonadota bacterium]